MQNFLKNRVKTEASVAEAKKLGEKGETREKKGKFSGGKTRRLDKEKESYDKEKRSKSVYIKDDLTREEREIQRKLRARVRKERENGKG